MLFTPKLIGNIALSPDALKEDKKTCIKIGPCGIGKKAVYMNSFFIDCTFYAVIGDVRRIFKRVAMSKNGFKGKGAFSTMPYLVVLLSNGTEKQCNFKYEFEVDNFINRFHELYPDIPIHSAEAEKRIAEEKAKEEARYVKNLSEAASASINEIRCAKDYLTSKIAISDELSRAAKQKRVIDNIKPGYKFVAGIIVIMSILACIYGVYCMLEGRDYSLYLLLFGAAFIFYALSMQVLPTARNNSRAAKKEFDAAVDACRDYIKGYGSGSFPIPAQYAHPYVFDRMIRVIREGRAESVSAAYEIMKADLKAINNTVTVSQVEYDEITAVKPMFLICGYSDEYQ